MRQPIEKQWWKKVLVRGIAWWMATGRVAWLVMRGQDTLCIVDGDDEIILKTFWFVIMCDAKAWGSEGMNILVKRTVFLSSQDKSYVPTWRNKTIEEMICRWERWFDILASGCQNARWESVRLLDVLKPHISVWLPQSYQHIYPSSRISYKTTPTALTKSSVWSAKLIEFILHTNVSVFLNCDGLIRRLMARMIDATRWPFM